MQGFISPACSGFKNNNGVIALKDLYVPQFEIGKIYSFREKNVGFYVDISSGWHVDSYIVYFEKSDIIYEYDLTSFVVSKVKILKNN